MDYIVQVGDTRPELLGGKARALADLSGIELPIPAWFVLSPKAFDASLASEAQKALSEANEAGEIARLLDGLLPSPDVLEALLRELSYMCPNGESVAVRSSASDEDGALHSFAGQLDSFLFVPPEDVSEKVAAVWKSGFSERVLAYRRENGLPLVATAPSVLIQCMVDPEVSGVAFGADPVSGRRDVAVVSALYGMGTLLVSGDSDADTYHIDSDGNILDRRIAEKRIRHRFDPNGREGIAEELVEENRATAPALDDKEVCAVARLVRKAGDHFGVPQDIEWGIANGKLHLLQSRPITTLVNDAQVDNIGVYNLWDNSNITESYSGVTTPLTFSFVRRIYEEVYRQFCIILRVPSARVAANDYLFKNMLGLIRGNVFYNLLNWYRVLALLPGFKVNRGFMEQMMGVKEALPEQALPEQTQVNIGVRVADTARLGRTLSGLIVSHARFPWTMEKFMTRMNSALEVDRETLSAYGADELVANFRELEVRLLKHWDAPLVNDFFAMIFSGLLRGLSKKWLGDEALHNDLLCGEGGMISAEPAKRVRELAEIASKDEDFAKLLESGVLEDIQRALQSNSPFAEEYEDYLQRFGDRCLEELKLESPTLRDEPLTLLRSIGTLALNPPRVKPTMGKNEDLREGAEAQMKKSLRLRPIRMVVFAWVLKNARDRVRDRENLRFERTRLFGRVRTIFVEIGKRLQEGGRLEDPRDIFYLEQDEILGFVEGTTTTTDLKGLVRIRKAEFDAYRSGPPPADRFETYGMVHVANSFLPEASEIEAPKGESLTGLGCCPGVIRGVARVVRDPRNAGLKAGEVLVAERTDPGWVLLFPLAAGLLVERGSLLSHSAIVAREMGIPAIVSLPNVTRWLRDGDVVQLNGSTGEVIRLEQAEASPAHEE